MRRSQTIYRGGSYCSELHPKGVEQSQSHFVTADIFLRATKCKLYYNKLEKIWHIHFEQIYLLKIQIFGLVNVGQDS